MKKIVIVILTAVLFFTLTGCGKNSFVPENNSGTDENISASESKNHLDPGENESDVIVGGWNEQNSEITDELLQIFEKATENLVGVKYTPVKLISTQVVAGINYKFLCRQSFPDGNKEALKTVTVYRDLAGNVTVTEIKDYN